jgi:magnesium chelatase subunit I
VNITGILDPALRVEVVRRRAAFEDDPEKFAREWEAEEEKLRRQIVAAKALLPQVVISDEMLFLIARIAIEMGVDGHRADLVMMKAAKTMAALNGREEVSEEDVHQSVDLALLHRMRRKPFQELAIDRRKLEDVLGGPKHAHNHSHAHVHAHPHTHTHTHTHTHAHSHRHSQVHSHGHGHHR